MIIFLWVMSSESCTQTVGRTMMAHMKFIWGMGRLYTVWRFVYNILIVALHCTLRDLFDRRSYLATEEKICEVCGKPSTKSCGECRKVKCCSKAMIPRGLG